MRLRGELDRGALKRALDRIVARHEALRTRFEFEEGEPVQRITPEGEGGLHGGNTIYEARGSGSRVGRLMAEEAGTAFDLERGPLIRGRLVRVGEQEHVLLITMHHIVSDGWSMGVLFNELSALYGAYVRGEQDPLAEMSVQYADYAVWQREWMEGEVLREQGEYWRKTLAGVPAVTRDPARPGASGAAGLCGSNCGVGVG